MRKGKPPNQAAFGLDIAAIGGAGKAALGHARDDVPLGMDASSLMPGERHPLFIRVFAVACARRDGAIGFADARDALGRPRRLAAGLCWWVGGIANAQCSARRLGDPGLHFRRAIGW